MERLSFNLSLLFLVCVYAAPVLAAKWKILDNSSFGLAGAEGGSKAFGTMQDNKSGDIPVKDDRSGDVPVPEKAGEIGKNLPDVTVIDNVNAGAAFAAGNSVTGGVVKNNKIAENPFGFGQ